MSRRKHRLAVAALLAGGILFGLASAEALLRVRGVLYTYVAPHPDPALHYVLQPGLRGRVAGIPIEHNSRGLRDREYPDTPAPDTMRILVLGDSITYSRLSPAAVTFVKRLESTLNASSGGRRFEVLNAGVSGYTSCQEEAFFKNVASAYHPHIVIWQYCLNDVEDPSDPFGGGREGYVPLPDSWKKGLRDHVVLWSFFRVQSYELLHRLGILPKDASDLNYARSVFAYYDERERERRDRAWECLIRGRDAIEAGSGRMVLVVFPFAMQATGDPEYPDSPQRDVLERCRQAGIHCLDLLPLFEREGGWELFLKPDFIHLSERGHEVAAAAIGMEVRRFVSESEEASASGGRPPM